MVFFFSYYQIYGVFLENVKSIKMLNEDGEKVIRNSRGKRHRSAITTCSLLLGLENWSVWLED